MSDWQAQLRRKVEAREAAEAVLDNAMDDLYEAMLEAFDGGASYRQIAEVVGLSRIRVGQVLRLQRAKTAA